MKRILILTALLLASLVHADEYLGIYLMGNKIGYASYGQVDDTLEGKALKRTDSMTSIDASLLGTTLKMIVNAQTWKDANGKPIRMISKTTSGGRTQEMTANFGAQNVVIEVDSSGVKSTKTLLLPNGVVTDDPLTPLLAEGLKPGASKEFYVLDSSTVSFVKTTVEVKGSEEIDIKGKKLQAVLVNLIDPRATMQVYLSDKGDLLKISGPMGMEMYPETKEEALKAGEGTGSNDLAMASAIKPDQDIPHPETLKKLTLLISGRDLSKVPSGDNQKTLQQGDAWKVTIEPVRLSASKGLSLKEVQKMTSVWKKPDLHIPSDSERFVKLARQIVGKQADTRMAAFAVQNYVYKRMRANAGIGVLRDASEVLDSCEGVCRDYAILTATLMRSAGIPTRLASGLVNWNGTFYYHAWVEIFDGKQWIGVDSTQPANQISAAHVKLAQGTVAEAFTFMLLDKVKISVLEQKN